MISTIAGHRFLTDFQAKKLAAQLEQKVGLKISALDSQQVYVFDQAISGADHTKAVNLLNQGEEVALKALKLVRFRLWWRRVLARLARGHLRRPIFLITAAFR